MPNVCTHLKEKQENIRPEEIIGIHQWPTIYSGSKKLSILNVVNFPTINGDCCVERVSSKNPINRAGFWRIFESYQQSKISKLPIMHMKKFSEAKKERKLKGMILLSWPRLFFDRGKTLKKMRKAKIWKHRVKHERRVKDFSQHALHKFFDLRRHLMPRYDV